MNKAGKSWSLSAKLTLVYSISILIISGGLTFGLYWELRIAQRQAIHERLLDILSFAAPSVDGDFHSLIHSGNDENSAYYRVVSSRLQSIQSTSDVIKRIYTLRENEQGEITFVVDVNPMDPASVGQAYSRTSELLEAGLSNITFPVVEKDIYTDNTGTYLSGYAPIYDQFRNLDGVLGIDIDANAVTASEAQARKTALWVFLLTVLPSLILGWVLARYMTSPVNDLVQGAERVAKGQFNVPVNVRSHDELGRLAETFNHMTEQLKQTLEGLELEITERKLAEAELSIQRDFTLQILENMGQGLTIVDLDGRFEYVNPAFCNMLGRSEKEILGRFPREFTATEDLTILRVAVLQRDQGETTTYENRLIRADGREVPVMITGVPRIENDEITGAIAVISDLTERVKAERATRERQRYLEGVLSAAPNAIVTLDAKNRIVDWNAGAERLFGYHLEEVIGKDIDHLISKEKIFEEATAFTQLVASGERLYPTKTIRYNQAGFPIHVIISGAPIIVNGTLHGIVAVYTDITELNQTESALQESEARNQAILNALPDLIFVQKSDGTYLDYNAPEPGALYVPPHQFLGKKMQDIFPEEFSAFILSYIEQAVVTGQPQIYEYQLTIEKQLQYFEARIVSYSEDKVLSIIRNITERKRTDAINASRLHLMQFATTHSLDELLEETLNETEKLTDSLIGFCHFVDDDQIHLALQNWSTRTKKSFCRAEGKGLHYPIDEAGVWIDCVSQRKPVVHNDYASLPHRKGMPEGHAEVMRELVVPVQRGDKIVAIFGVGNKAVDYTQKDVEAVSLMADLAWEIAERKRTEDSLQKYTRQLEILNTVTATLSTSLALDEVLKLILQQIRAVIQIDSATIFLKEAEGLRVVLDWGLVPSIVGELFPDDELFKVIDDTREPLILNYPLRDPRFKNWGNSETIETWLCVPLMVRDILIGFMTLDGDHPNAFSQEQLSLIESFAAQSAQAIDNALQFSNAQRRMERLTSLHDIDQAISNNLDLHVTLNVLLGHVLHQLQVDAAAILLYQPKLQNLEFVAGQGFRTNVLQFTNLRLGQGFAGRAALERKIVKISNLSSDETGFLRSPEFHTEQFVAYIGVPLIAKGDIIGVLEIYHRQLLDPDPEWVVFLNTLAGQAAIAIDNINLFSDLQKSNLELVQAYDATIEGWAKALELRDMETEGHSRRVVDLTLYLARKMGISSSELVHVRRGALLHDIGKMGIPDHILQKPGRLSENEWKIMRQHPVYAYKMLSSIPYLKSALDIPYCHHEKWDGTGYPRGLKGDQIPLAARIFSVVDVWDALLSNRPYRGAWSHEKVMAYIQDQAEKHFDPQVVYAFRELWSEGHPLIKSE